jgi:hypothetical protein
VVRNTRLQVISRGRSREQIQTYDLTLFFLPEPPGAQLLKGILQIVASAIVEQDVAHQAE